MAKAKNQLNVAADQIDSNTSKNITDVVSEFSVYRNYKAF